MKFAAVLAALVAVPVAAAGGYVAHRESPPPFGEYLASTQAVKHVPGQDTDNWLAVATSGPNKDGAMDVFQALASYPTHKDLERAAQGKVVYVEIKCASYTTGGKKTNYVSPRVVTSCSSERRTREQAEDYMRELLKPEPKS